MTKWLILRQSAQNLPELSDRRLYLNRNYVSGWKYSKFQSENAAKTWTDCPSWRDKDEYIQSEINGLPKLMNDIGVADPSEFTLEQIPSDFLYLDSIFC